MGLDERHAPSPKALSPSPTGFEGDRSRRGRAGPPPTLGARGAPVIVSDAIGATTAAAVARAPAMHVALISFGIAALLFLVTEELLLEAHEAQEHSAHEEHIWWVDMFFFLGFLLSFLMDKLLDTD